MTAVLVLLAFLSFAMLASQRGSFDELLARAATPVLVGIGAAISPDGLGFLPPSVVRGLAPAVDVGLLWLAAISGIRATTAVMSGSTIAKTMAVACLIAAAASAAALVVLAAAERLGHPLVKEGALVPAAVLLGASVAIIPSNGRSSRRAALMGVGELLALAGSVSALAWWSGPAAAAITVGLGCLAVGVVRLLAGRLAPMPVIVMASTTLTAGLASLASLPGAVAGLAAGALAGQMRGGAGLLRWLRSTERPIRGVVTVLLAASVGINASQLALGLALGGATMIALLVVHLLPFDDSPPLERLADTMATSSTPLVLLASFAAADHGPGLGLLAPLLIALATADACAFAVSIAARAPRERGQA